MPSRGPIWVTVAITRSRWPAAFPATPPLVFAVRPAPQPVRALLPPADLPLLLGELLVARIGDPPHGPPLLRRPGQFPALPRRAPRREMRGVQPLSPQQRPDRARRLARVGLPDDLPFVLHRKPPSGRLRRHLDLRSTEGSFQYAHRLQSLLALDTKLPGGRCLTHIGREGRAGAAVAPPCGASTRGMGTAIAAAGN